MRERARRRLRERVSESVGKEIEDAVVLFSGPSFWLWTGGAVIVALVVFVATGVGGVVGGLVIGALVGSWYLVAQQVVLAVSSEEAHLVALDSPPLRRGMSKGELMHHPRGAAPASKDGARVDYGGRTLQALIFSGGDAERVVDKAAGDAVETEAAAQANQPPFPP